MSVYINDTPEYKNALLRILAGYSISFIENDRVFIKHLDVNLSLDSDAFYQNEMDRLLSDGVKSRSQMLEEAIKNGIWKSSNEDKIEACKKEISTLRDRKSKALLPSEAKKIQSEIDFKYFKLIEALRKRDIALSPNAEDLAEKRRDDFIIFNSFYKDPSLKIPYFDFKFEDDMLTEDLMFSIKEVYEKEIIFNLKNKIQLLALSEEMLSMLRLANGSYNILGKPIKDYSFLQKDLMDISILFKDILHNSKHSPPDSVRKDPDKLINWWEGIIRGEKIKNGKKTTKTNNSVSSLMGATKEDLKTIYGEENIINPAQEMSKMKKSDGIIPMSEMIGMFQ